ncbi:hypothetical protein HPB50_013710 [Hyalomma asiaticum]|uniref:Uncharacterized protein n=1 Tax=Hyalomma asiaticum TaxID=266040 RepID=A0ACB7THF3_HYAAI|nr:hypothetical protein HPB50_013710 [Hyalomma asiaticum]
MRNQRDSRKPKAENCPIKAQVLTTDLDAEVKPVIVGVTQRQPRSSRLLRPCSMEGSDIEAALSRRLHEAVRTDDASGVAAALSSGILTADDPSKEGGGCTAILEATRLDRAAVASVLFEFGCDPCLGDNRGWTALHEVFRSPAVAAILFEHVPPASWKRVTDSVYGLTPLHACVKAAVSSSAAPTVAQLEVIREVASRCKADAVSLDGDTCLHLAASGRHDRPEVVRLLLEAAHIRNMQNARGETALHLAIVKGHYESAAVLIQPPTEKDNATVEQETADVLDPSLCDRFGQTVLHYCASRNAANLLELLLQNYGVRDIQDLRGDTALHVAARRGHDKCVALLLGAGADASLRNDEGMTPLDMAVAAGFADATRLLYESASEPLLRNADALRRHDSVRRCTVIGKMFLSVG